MKMSETMQLDPFWIRSVLFPNDEAALAAFITATKRKRQGVWASAMISQLILARSSPYSSQMYTLSNKMRGVSYILYRSDPELLLYKSLAPVHEYCYIDEDISLSCKVVI